MEHTANRFGIVHKGKILKEITSEDLKETNDRIEIKVSDIGKAREVLSKYDIDILEEKISSSSLEDYYFNLVGGEDA